MDELFELSADALMELVSNILTRQSSATDEAIDSMAVSTKVAHNVAERLLTGRRAEEFFIENSLEIVGIARSELIDLRQAAIGFDFGIYTQKDVAIEVKGMKTQNGQILFTDKEWNEAKFRNTNYWLVVIGNLQASPVAKVFRNPTRVLSGKCFYQKCISAQWRSVVSTEGGIQLGGQNS